jgi:hypothetical protein
VRNGRIFLGAVGTLLAGDPFRIEVADDRYGWLNEEGELKHEDWVPLSSVIGTEKIPAAAAQTIKRAVELMRDKGDLTQKNLWQALEYLAVDYLAGVPA